MREKAKVAVARVLKNLPPYRETRDAHDENRKP